MWKMFDWLWKAAAAALLASFLAIWTTGYIVNSYVEALLEEYGIPLEKPPFALSGLWGRLWGVDGAGAGLTADREPIGGFEDARNWSGGRNSDAGRTDGVRTPSDRGGETQEPAGGDGGNRPDGAGPSVGSDLQDGQGPREGTDLTGGSLRDGAILPVGTGASDEGAVHLPDAESGAGESAKDGASREGAGDDFSAGGGETGYGRGPEARGGAGETVVSTEELLEAKSRLTEDERNRLFAILVGKVPQEEWQRISEYAEGGFTADELLRVQQIVAAHLDREEYEELMGILNKF
ncbi:MAG: hypothetical protein A9Z00_05565 [Thermobacillus sp. ZCTH02-B1]|uniref:hypothetical protein n=1 Tax=Thermobacillus sp. ZCTH02-B1 TaxID=1858795 RepID=UPI000B573C56|nr:hypothetical protein [Thermobacillus sp. ZCTH02-B1]OUM93692.1 MAG: hypothetical protein A9Z00_05565 [Thermobacillus sp. ZCTH02-B1]